jgi:hypothetical protein
LHLSVELVVVVLDLQVVLVVLDFQHLVET